MDRLVIAKVRVLRGNINLGEGVVRSDGVLLLEEDILSVGDTVSLVGKILGLSSDFEIEERLFAGLYRITS